ncbi:hypothetical protein T12_15521 [Trichinella patagoniensis]|uniref:Uncharacterized protein n=1 Tax=Trichinella patagoniensis TaxID=990121 RepID=A0A0V0ZEQ4_9BILA|nr:hypothetical protein T12_15521 [Trichinella patagoniensis]
MAAFLLIETQLGRVYHATSGFSSPRPKANKNQSETLVLWPIRPADVHWPQGRRNNSSFKRHFKSISQWPNGPSHFDALVRRRCRRLTIWKIFFQKSNCRVQNLNNAPQFGCLSASLEEEEEEEEGKRFPFCSFLHLYNFDEILEN